MANTILRFSVIALLAAFGLLLMFIGLICAGAGVGLFLTFIPMGSGVGSIAVAMSMV